MVIISTQVTVRGPQEYYVKYEQLFFFLTFST